MGVKQQSGLPEWVEGGEVKCWEVVGAADGGWSVSWAGTHWVQPWKRRRRAARAASFVSKAAVGSGPSQSLESSEPGRMRRMPTPVPVSVPAALCLRYGRVHTPASRRRKEGGTEQSHAFSLMPSWIHDAGLGRLHADAERRENALGSAELTSRK